MNGRTNGYILKQYCGYCGAFIRLVHTHLGDNPGHHQKCWDDDCGHAGPHRVHVPGKSMADKLFIEARKNEGPNTGRGRSNVSVPRH